MLFTDWEYQKLRPQRNLFLEQQDERDLQEAKVRKFTWVENYGLTNKDKLYRHMNTFVTSVKRSSINPLPPKYSILLFAIIAIVFLDLSAYGTGGWRVV